MKKILLIGLLAPAFFAFAACAGNQQLKADVERMQVDLQDLRQSNQRLASQLEELRIQLSVLRQRLGQGKAGPGAARELQPSLRVVKLRPQEIQDGVDEDEEVLGTQQSEVTRGEPVPLLTNKGKGRSVRHRLQRRPAPDVSKLAPVDPYEVQEKLPVDRRAAKRSLDEPLVTVSDETGADAGLELDGTPEGEGQGPGYEAYDKAFSLYRVNDFDRALDAFKRFMADYRHHERYADALFYLSNAHMMVGQVDQAEKGFLSLVERFPRDGRAAEALFLAGRCQEKAGRATKARGTYLQLVESYPRSSHAGAANRRLSLIR